MQIHHAIESDSSTPKLKLPAPLVHPEGVNGLLPLPLTDLGESYLLTIAGDLLRVYDISTLHEPELVSTTDVHWHNVTAVRLWFRKVKADGATLVEPYIVTTSLDQTIRKWRLAGANAVLWPMKNLVLISFYRSAEPGTSAIAHCTTTSKGTKANGFWSDS